jgi:hypothetical protein
LPAAPQEIGRRLRIINQWSCRDWLKVKLQPAY